MLRKLQLTLILLVLLQPLYVLATNHVLPFGYGRYSHVGPCTQREIDSLLYVTNFGGSYGDGNGLSCKYTWGDMTEAEATQYRTNALSNTPSGSSPNPNQSTPNAGALSGIVASLAGVGLPFGGAITEPPIPCNGGVLYVEALTGPTPGNYAWIPGTLSYMFGPPAFPSQWLLGRFLPPVPCIIGGVTRGLGRQIVFHGSSGAGPTPIPYLAPPVSPATQPPSDGSCQFSNMSTDTPAGKRAAEAQARLELGACNIQVRSSQTGGAPCGFGQNGLSAGCTDVSGLQCGAVRELCAIAQKCPLSITGGSEAGHQGHKSGREIDVAVDPACIARNFVPIDSEGCRYRDPATGTTFRNEAVCRAERTTGPHFHLCIGGNC